MHKEEALRVLDQLELSPEKRGWMEQYVVNHIEAKLNPIPETPKIVAPELSHFEIHPTMKELWKQKIKL